LGPDKSLVLQASSSGHWGWRAQRRSVADQTQGSHRLAATSKITEAMYEYYVKLKW